MRAGRATFRCRDDWDLDDAGAVQVQFGAKWWQLILARTLKKVVYTSYPLGNIERAIRVIVGLVLISLVFIGPQTAWGWIGVIPIITGATGYCPPYAMLGINTCKKS